MTGTIVTLALLVALESALLAATPFLMPPTECFTVTVPPSAKADPRVRTLYRSYALAMAALAVIGIPAMIILLPQADEGTITATVTAATLLPIIVSFALMLRARARIRALKQVEGWTAETDRSVAVVADASIPQPIPLAWELLHLILVAALAAYALLSYDRLPELIPLHAGFDGTVDDYAGKSWGTVLFPALMAAFMGIMFAFAHWGILRSKRPVNPASPATSALAYGRFARAQSIVMLVGGLALSACTGIAFFLSTVGFVSLGTAGTITTIAVLAFVGAEIWMAVRLGQSGGLLAAELRAGDELARDEDSRWKLGVFYANPDDPSIFVPKRFGVGWTLNFSRPAAWLLIVLLIALAIGSTLAASGLVG